MKIKKHENGNEYMLTRDGHWIRNFTRIAPSIDINNWTKPEDYGLLIYNQSTNISNPRMMNIASERKFYPNIVIVSDGYKFEEKYKLLEELPKDVIVIGTNRALAKWNVKGKKSMGFFVANNPYKECLSQLPTEHRYFPTCICSTRTNPEFVKKYRGDIYYYNSTPEENFSGTAINDYCIDDYRNPICGAIGLAYRFGAVKVLLFCCDDVFEDERPGAEKLPNGKYMYPQHRVSHDLIEGSLYWLRKQEAKRIKVGNHSSGLDYRDVPYIKEEGINDFFILE